jgi:hypothetical protein
MDGVITEANVVINITVVASDIEPPAPPSPSSSLSCEEQDTDGEDDTFVVKIETCPICHEEASSPMIVLECGHVFHEECFNAYVTYELKAEKKSVVCPFCRSSFLEIDITNNAHTTERDTLSAHREERRRIQEEIQQQINQSQTFQQRVRNFFQSRTGRHLATTIVEAILIAGIITIAYTSSCSSRPNC